MKKNPKDKIYTKIIAGKYKNKFIELPPLEITRSTKSILKESFFNVVQFDIIDKVFIEAFAGSGSIGLEALSRGAYISYFCEIDKNSYNILVNNIKNIDENNSFAIFGDAFIQIPALINNNLKTNRDFLDKEIILYLDPPFDFRDNMEGIYDRVFDMVKSLDNDNLVLIAIEHYSKIDIPKKLNRYNLKKTKKFGKSSISYYIL